MARFISLYLPQFHPTPENDEWWGKGFTEWINVAKAKPLFRGHNQPRIPADLGFYDLRVPEVREQQAQLAKEAGIEAFCYWHYYFGNGKRLLERPFSEVLESGKPDFPFCLAWANHSWYKKLWDPHAQGKDELLIEQKYPGVDDYTNHFFELLPAFKDPRYLKVNGRLFFIVYDGVGFEDVSSFINIWRRLASENGLSGFYFVTRDSDSRMKKSMIEKGFDAVYNDNPYNIHHHLSLLKKIVLKIRRDWFKQPTRFKYKDAIKYMISDDCINNDAIPVIVPNWDHSPRSGGKSIILTDSKPMYFAEIAEKAIEIVSNKPSEEQIVIVKSWNEWGEGNYMEPDQQNGRGYIEALCSAINKCSNKKK